MEDWSQKIKDLEAYKEVFFDFNDIDFEATFGYREVLANGNLAKKVKTQEFEEIHNSEQNFDSWVNYCTKHAETIYFLREILEADLLQIKTFSDEFGLQNNL